ncbi:hypothetical protein CAL7716_072360 [Calothrix sp. PCC 7716]|nr:hypothetical protein CAL7716_072360 [Calothrix sp. PCC 7716]
MKNLSLPSLLVLIVVTGVAAVAILDGVYRKDFMQLATAVVTGYFAHLQAPRREQ